jgi:MYXO-CTERM domain-containing protein
VMKRLVAILLLALIPAASAQDGCLQADPCVWVLQVDDQGFDETDFDGNLTATSGDWYIVDAINFADQTHQITVGDFETIHLESLEDAETSPFQIGLESFTITDDVSGETMVVTVTEADAIDESASSSSSSATSAASESKGTPAPFGILALGLLALLRRK